MKSSVKGNSSFSTPESDPMSVDGRATVLVSSHVFPCVSPRPKVIHPGVWGDMSRILDFPGRPSGSQMSLESWEVDSVEFDHALRQIPM